jgi:hypothetical protein
MEVKATANQSLAPLSACSTFIWGKLKRALVLRLNCRAFPNRQSHKVRMSADMDAKEKQLWCKAWRWLKRHGDASEALIDREIEACLKNKDQPGIEHWREIARAIEELKK